MEEGPLCLECTVRSLCQSFNLLVDVVDCGAPDGLLEFLRGRVFATQSFLSDEFGALELAANPGEVLFVGSVLIH